jgi:uncharacterized protein (TIGR03086 family)
MVMQVDVLEAFTLAHERAAGVVAGLGGALDRPTPCEKWDVRAVANHLVGIIWMFTLVNQGQPVGEGDGDLLGADPAAALAAAGEANLASWRAPGAFDGDRTYPFGAFPAPAAALVNLEEVVVHTWDLSKATGQDPAIDPAVAELVYGFCRSIPLDDYRAHGAFGPAVPVPAAAPVTDRLVALLGRQP